MKHLTDVLKSSMTSLYESIFDDDIFTRKIDPEKYIKDFLNEWYDLSINNVKIIEKNHQYIVNVRGNVRTKRDDIKSLTNGLFKFGTITGNFDCSFGNITTLEGCPDVVFGYFDCSGNNKLENLEHAPKKVTHLFNRSRCCNLKSLNGLQQSELAGFDCSYCNSLISLEGLPEKINGGLVVSCCSNLETLKGCPKHAKGYFEIRKCPKIDRKNIIDYRPNGIKNVYSDLF